MTTKRNHRLIALRSKAKREGWLHWVRSEADERAMLELGAYVDQRRIDHVVEFGHRYLRHTEGSTWAGLPFDLLSWQYEQLFGPLYGWVYDSEEWGRTIRRYRTAYVQLPKKNGKSPTAAYVGLYALCGDGEAGAKVFSVATSRDQASIVHSHATRMVDSSPELSDELKINRTTKAITHEATYSEYRVLSAAPRRNEGWNGHCCVADELHMWSGRALFDALRWMFASRPSPLFFMITTAGDDTNGVAYEQYEYGKSILNGRVIDHTYLPLIYEADPGDDVGAESTWQKANPSWGDTVKASEFRQAYNQALTSRAALDRFRQLRLNIWRTGQTGWLDVLEWDAGPDRRRKAVERAEQADEQANNSRGSAVGRGRTRRKAARQANPASGKA